ncbi:MAG: hypothetical protein WC853_13910 [Thermodesulfovibrionales bacterium]
METILKQLIDQLNSSVFVLLAILWATGWTIYKIGLWTAIFKHHDEKIAKIEGLADKVLVMRTKVDLIYENTLGSKRTVAALSPITLTEVGKEIKEKIKADAILEKHFLKLTKEIEQEKTENAYDIQMASMKIAKEKMLTLLNEEELLAVKQEAYNRGLIVEDIMSVLGVLLRDRILKLKGYPISDVDKHAPSKQT